MSNHVAPEQLIALADGELDAAQVTAVKAHLAGCVACQAEAELLGGFDRVVRAAAPAAGAGADPLPRAMEARLQDATRTLLAAHRSRRPLTAWLRGGSLLVAAAVLLLLLGGVFWPDPTPLAARVHYTEGAVVRGPGTRTFHLELSLPRATHLWILRRDQDGRLLQLLPGTNPVLAELEGDQPWPAGQAVRVPRDPLLDFAADWTSPATLFVVPTATRMTGSAAATALAELMPLADEAAITAALRVRAPEAIVLRTR